VKRDVTADDVINELLSLFNDLGADVTDPISKNESLNDTTRSQTLYAYASSIGGMLTFWHQDPEYIDENGNPRLIKMEGASPSFKSLARKMVPAIKDTHLLSELEKLGAVTIDTAGLINVHMRSIPVYEDKKLAVQHTVTTLYGFIKTLRHNLGSDPSNAAQLFHRIAWNDEFDRREIPALKIRAKRHGQNFLESFDDWMMSKAIKPRKVSGRVRKAKVSVGIYLSIEKT